MIYAVIYWIVISVLNLVDSVRFLGRPSKLRTSSVSKCQEIKRASLGIVIQVNCSTFKEYVFKIFTRGLIAFSCSVLLQRFRLDR